MTASPWTFGDESEAVGPGSITLVQGTSFAICDRAGDVAGRGVHGVFVADTRVCSTLGLLIDGHPCEPLAVSVDEPSVARFVGRSADRTVIVRRTLRVGRGAVLDIELRERTHEGATVEVALVVGSDLADLFAVKEGRAEGRAAPAEALDDGDGVRLGWADGRRAALVRAGEVPDAIVEGTLRWSVALPPRGRWSCRIQVAAVREGHVVPVGAVAPALVARHMDQPALTTDIPGLRDAFVQTAADLDALRLVDPAHPQEPVIAAGAPWFMTLFGRDSIVTSWMAMMLDHGLGLATARTLARLQGRTTDAETEEQPGRILHEVRFGAGASLSLADAERYYGTVDATPLFVLLVHELWRWGVPWSAIEPLLPAVDAALSWVAGPGDSNGDGFVEYERMTERGLLNQGWKDSWDAIAHADGRLASPPIALAEVQGYVYAAWRAGAALAAAAGATKIAVERSVRADAVRDRFDEAFWLPELDWYALALDGEGRRVDALASNLGHLLWCGIVPPERVPMVADALLSPELASGWGVRTLATTMARYDPLGYHTGSVWPHDTAIAVAGLRRAGCTEHAVRLAECLLAAARASGGRLPELFAGLGPEDLAVPVSYPASCSPQAWASAAPLLVLRALLGLEPDVPGGRIVLDPVLPPGSTRLRVDGVPLAGTRVSVEIDGDAVAVRGLPSGVAVLLRG